MMHANISSLIPRVRAVNDHCLPVKKSYAPKELGAPDSCDIARIKPEDRNKEDEASAGLRKHPDAVCVRMPGRVWREGQLHPPSSSGLIRGSILLTADGCGVDAWVKPEHNGGWGDATALPSIGGAAW